MSGDQKARDERLGVWVDQLSQRLESQPLLWIQGEPRDRIACLRRWVEAVGERGAKVVSLEGHYGAAPLVERLPDAGQGAATRLLVIDHWRPDLIAPDQIEWFQRWLGRFIGEGPATVALGVGQNACFEDEQAELGPLPDWALEEIEVVDLGSLSAVPRDLEPVQSANSDLFPPLAGAGGPTRSAQFPSGARNRLPEEDLSPADPLVDLIEAHHSPVRRLFDVLVELHSVRGVELNIRHDDEFASMIGPLEARFCEWTYVQLERRRLATKLLECNLMSPANIWSLASRFEIKRGELENLDRRQQVRKALEGLGICEPSLPPAVATGVEEIRALHEVFDAEEMGVNCGIEGVSRDPEAMIPAARRGAERLLKLIVCFLWSVGLDDIIFDVCDQQLQGYRSKGLRPERGSSQWLQKGDLGTLNYLLRAVDRERQERKRELIFLRDRQDYWGDAVFHPFNQLATALSKEVHEGMAREQRRSQQRSATRSVIRIIDGSSLRIPGVVQFFRQYNDDLGTHYEGWTLHREYPESPWKPERIKFYEVGVPIELHRPYLYLAATNPSAVDASYALFDERFLSAP